MSPSRRTALPALLTAVALVILSALASPADAAQDDQTGERLPTRGPVTATTGQKVAEPLDLVGGLLRGVPIIDGDFADPYALSERDAIYIYATNTVDANVPVVELPKDDSAAHPGNDSQ